MAFTQQQQELYDFAKNSLPGWFFQVPRAEEMINAFVAVFDRVRTNITERQAQSLILTATGIYLDQHGADRGTQKQDGETDAAYRQRMRSPQNAVTRPLLLLAAQDIVDAEGIAGSVAGFEIRRDRAYFGTYTARTGTGGEFVDAGSGLFEFTPDTLYALPIEVNFARSGAQGNPRITFSGSASAGNDGTFEVTALTLNAVQYTNGSGVAEVDAGASWSLNKYDVEDNDREGRRRAYFGRGYQIGGLTLGIIIPRGTGPFSTAGTQTSVAEMARQKKAAGVLSVAEYRQT